MLALAVVSPVAPAAFCTGSWSQQADQGTTGFTRDLQAGLGMPPRGFRRSIGSGAEVAASRLRTRAWPAIPVRQGGSDFGAANDSGLRVRLKTPIAC